ncbi:phospholipase D family protein [Oceanobacter mangrovi]|uniref:phospholipase D family protein n=1 Tax=Oceanobacter mangrovi TaxID=2862510 RepID=UPI001C8ED0A0|nr:phospholipase D family protein [Oceanobacter mangrovi]
MATFLNKTSIDRLTRTLIQKSARQLTLVSPYLQLEADMLDLITAKADQGLQVRLIYRNHQFLSQIYSLARHPNIAIYVSPKLNARCCCNESNIILSSRNLEPSRDGQQHDMGILLTRSKDADAFSAACRDIMDILEHSEQLFAEKQATEQLSITTAVSERTPSAEMYFALKNQKVQFASRPGFDNEADNDTLLETSAWSEMMKLDTDAVRQQLVNAGMLVESSGKLYMTARAKQQGARTRMGEDGLYFLWPSKLELRAN